MFIKVESRPTEGSDKLLCPLCSSERLEVRIDTAQNTISIMCNPCLYLYMDAGYTVKYDNTDKCKQ